MNRYEALYSDIHTFSKEIKRGYPKALDKLSCLPRRTKFWEPFFACPPQRKQL